ncbi:hypothetical protein V6N11_039364 [Hibiscus sabdariffa]|uniref:Uncharacterized protein n=1 Tax=Hibiscus sabdariffa TaxID=183260 RepID=A0ABR2SNM0_9ROSI
MSHRPAERYTRCTSLRLFFPEARKIEQLKAKTNEGKGKKGHLAYVRRVPSPRTSAPGTFYALRLLKPKPCHGEKTAFRWS